MTRTLLAKIKRKRKNVQTFSWKLNPDPSLKWSSAEIILTTGFVLIVKDANSHMGWKNFSAMKISAKTLEQKNAKYFMIKSTADSAKDATSSILETQSKSFTVSWAQRS